MPKKFFSILLIFIALTLTSCGLKKDSTDAAKAIAIQNNGRIKSLDTFSRQTVELIAGRETWKHHAPLNLILQVLSDPEAADKLEWIKVDHHGLKVELGLDKEKQYFSHDELSTSLQKIEQMARQSQTKRDNGEALTVLDNQAELLFTRVLTFQRLVSGENITVLPPSTETPNENWTSPFTSQDIRAIHFKALVQFYRDHKWNEFEQKAAFWKDYVSKTTEHTADKQLALEVHYYNFRPFELTWIAYLLGFIMLAVFGGKKKSVARAIGVVIVSLALFFHSYGLVMRILILSRPPVSNMYESMIFMNWVLMAIALIFSALRKDAVFLTAGSLVSAFIMIYANSLLPIDAGLEVLVPVLRSNYWLTIHVLTIVSSYGALGLAMALGHRQMFLGLTGRLSAKEEDVSAQLIYRTMQVGILLLGIGTVLGGVWANESWGRFWGWDPKETWALITFLSYLVIVHLRYTKWINHFWMAISSIIGFLLVLMTWYGVNFVLGKGLHSYGAGSGGKVWVALYLIFECIFVALVLIKKYSSPKRLKRRG